MPAGEFIAERMAMHRLDYTEGKTNAELAELAELAAAIRAYTIWLCWPVVLALVSDGQSFIMILCIMITHSFFLIPMLALPLLIKGDITFEAVCSAPAI